MTLIRYLARTTSFLAKSCVLSKLCFWIGAGGTETVKVPDGVFLKNTFFSKSEDPFT